MYTPPVTIIASSQFPVKRRRIVALHKLRDDACKVFTRVIELHGFGALDGELPALGLQPERHVFVDETAARAADGLAYIAVRFECC
jgi:hypothetical protein